MNAVKVLSTIALIALVTSSGVRAGGEEIGPYRTAGSRSAYPKYPAICSDGYHVSSVQTLKNAYNNFNPINIWCRSIVHPATDKNLSAAEEVGPLVTKEPQNDGGGNKVTCDPGYRVSRLQMTVDGDKTHQRSIRIWCKRFSNETPVSGPQPQMPLVTTEPESSGGSTVIDIPENAYVSELVGYQETSRPYVRSIELHVKPFPNPRG